MITITQRIALLLLTLSLAACVNPGSRTNGHYGSSGTTHHNINKLQCRLSDDGCMYDGAYEVGEDAYAEQRAKELNQAQAEKLRRQSQTQSSTKKKRRLLRW